VSTGAEATTGAAAVPLTIVPATVGPLAANAYLLGDPASGDAVIVDPGDEGHLLLAQARAGGWRLREVWLTHAHFDHVGAVDEVVADGDVPVRLHPADLPIYRTAAQAAARWAGLRIHQPTVPPLALEHGAALALGSLRAEVRHLPGHSPGHVVFWVAAAGAVFAGDTLFRGGIGRTDLPGGDHETLLRGIREQLFTLPPETVVWPGHGPPTTVAEERATNPFLAM
jgi:hydroxyacylglutathione hydrolase